MTTSSLIAPPATPCPPWCTITPEDHAAEIADGCTFHRSQPTDTWTLDYSMSENVVSVSPEIYFDVNDGEEELIVIAGDTSRGSLELSEFTPADAQRLGMALLTASVTTATAGHPRPDQDDVDTLRGLLDLLEDFPSNDQRARFLLTSNWMRDRGALAGARIGALEAVSAA